MVLQLRDGHSGRTKANFWHWEVKEHIYFRRLIMSNHNVCFLRIVCGEVCGKLRLWSSDDQLFSQVWLFHVQHHGEVGAPGMSGMDAGNSYTRVLKRKLSSRFPPPTILDKLRRAESTLDNRNTSSREASLTLQISDWTRNHRTGFYTAFSLCEHSLVGTSVRLQGLLPSSGAQAQGGRAGP